MPELPEVHTTATGLNKAISGLKIIDIWTDYGGSSYHDGKDNIKNPLFFNKFKKEVIGTKIIHVTRRAKNILIHLSNDKTILAHMKMTGHFLYGKYKFDKKFKFNWEPSDQKSILTDPFNRFIHFVFVLSDGKHVVMSDMRKFAKITLLDSTNMLELEKTEHLLGIGPEPLEKDFTFTIFIKQIGKKPKGKIKTVLMDQSIIAGIGNIYSDEVLWRSNVHPESEVSKIPQTNLKEMFKAIKETLKKGIDFGGDSMSDYRNVHGERGKFQDHHRAYRRTNKPCQKTGCEGTIIRKVVGTRSAHFCNKHQEKF